MFKHKRIINQILNYLPGLVILIVGMVALKSSLILMNAHEQLFLEQINGGAAQIKLQTDQMKQVVTLPHERLYWSVIALGLCGFVLLVLNAHKMKRLSEGAEERRETLKLLESRLQAMEASRDGIGIVSVDGNLIYFNSALMTLHGISEKDRDNFINQPWTSLYNEDGKKNINENVLPSLQKNKFWHGEAPVRRHDNVVIPAELSLTLLDDGSIIGTARDISKRKKAESQNADLQKQFFQAQKMEAIGRLAGGIAHDFNNILAAMNGYAEFLSDDLEEGSPEHKFAENILKAGHQAKKLVDEILTFSRIKDDNFENTDLSALLTETLNIFDVTLPKTVTLKTNIPKTQHMIFGNGDHISQMVMNMCVNALDAIEGNQDNSGKGEVTVSMQVVDENLYREIGVNKLSQHNVDDMMHIMDLKKKKDGSSHLIFGDLKPGQNYIMFSVQDTGSGMTYETLEHIFEPFFTTKAVDKGTGLGMSMAHGVVQSHKGVIVIKTKVGEGTTFSVLLPQSTISDMNSPETGDINVEPINLSGNILLVEDQQDVAQMTTMMLERIGFTVKRCSSGVEALDDLRENAYNYDLILTDQNMPKMTGLELVIEAEHDECAVPFILLSGYSKKKILSIMEEHSLIHAILRKPIKQNDLAVTLKTVLEKTSKKVA